MSEVARIRRQIELECEVLRLAFDGPAIVASHRIINARYENLGKQKEELAQHVGEQAATDELTHIYAKIVG